MAYYIKYNYTKQELWEADLADLETDIQCAHRNGYLEYAAEMEKRLALLRATPPDDVVRDMDGYPMLDIP